jgi:hypothetical protein
VPSTSGSFKCFLTFRFFCQNIIFICQPSKACYISRPSLPQLDYLNKTRVKLLIMKFCEVFCQVIQIFCSSDYLPTCSIETKNGGDILSLPHASL